MKTVMSSLHAPSCFTVNTPNTTATRSRRREERNAPLSREMPSGGEQKHQSAQREVGVTAVQEIARIECVQVQRQKDREHQE